MSLADPLIRTYQTEEYAEMRLLTALGMTSPGPDGKDTAALPTRLWLESLLDRDEPVPVVDPHSPEAGALQAHAEAMFGGPGA